MDVVASAKARYRVSDKRAATRLANEQAIKNAAWNVFATNGLDGSTAGQIVSESGVSKGTFYNYYGSCEAVFDALLADRMSLIRTHTQAARDRADTIEGMLLLSYKSFLDFVLSLDGGLAFCERNQRHIRLRLGMSGPLAGFLDDIRADLARRLPGKLVADVDLGMMVNLIVAVGLETMLQPHEPETMDTAAISRTMTRFLMTGIQGFYGPGTL